MHPKFRKMLFRTYGQDVPLRHFILDVSQALFIIIGGLTVLFVFLYASRVCGE